MQPDALMNKRCICFSDNPPSSKSKVKDKNFFKEQNKKDIKKDNVLYIFDLSRFSSKYIEKLKRTLTEFFRVKETDGILFFDEFNALSWYKFKNIDL